MSASSRLISIAIAVLLGAASGLQAAESGQDTGKGSSRYRSLEERGVGSSARNYDRTTEEAARRKKRQLSIDRDMDRDGLFDLDKSPLERGSAVDEGFDDDR